MDCRLQRSYEWALRCVHEAQLHPRNSFLTLTYDDEHLPPDLSLRKAHWQKFCKRVRKGLEALPSESRTFRYLHCGEYGDVNGRPHYHAIVFGQDWSHDRVPVRTRGKHPLWMSAELTEKWRHGLVFIGEASFQSAAYVARYALKKRTRKEHRDSGDTRTQEYVTMSRNPGIGSAWFEQYRSDVYPSDFVVQAGRKIRPPRYYDRLLEAEDSAAHEAIAEARARRRAEREPDTPDRRYARESRQRAESALRTRA